jgi:glyoxylase-like metal-dependent hydrolase (beta-lactamase superfamily II)
MTALTRRSLLAGAAVTAVAAPTIGVPQARAAAPMVGKQGPSFYRYKIGDFEVTALNEGIARNNTPANQAVNKTLPDVQKALGDAFLPTDHIIGQFNIVVVNTGRNLVLIDAGFGDNGPPTVGSLVNNMNAAGIDPKNIDTLLVSHFHPDHISGIRQKAGALNFPNAEIMVPAAEWKYWTDAGEESKAPQTFKPWFGNVKRVFDPIAKDVKQYEYGKDLVPGISSVDARGHSPGHGAFLVTSGNGKLLVTSDTANHQILIRNPDWALWADMDAAMAATARKRVLDMAATDKIQIAAYHLPFPSTGFISKQGSGYEFHPGHWQPVL